MRQFLIVILVLIWTSTGSLSEALTYDDARLLALDQNIDGLETAFADHQTEFEDDEITRHAYLAPYQVFKTTEPLVQQATESWITANPKSPYAMTARGHALSYLAYLFRGYAYVNETPSGALVEMGVRLREAIPLYRSALKAQPAQLSAAYDLQVAAAYLGDEEAQDRALDVIFKHAGHDQATLATLWQTYPRWNGKWHETPVFCNLRTDPTTQMTFEQCMAVAEYAQTGSEDALRLLAEGPRSLFLRYHIEALALDGRWDEARALAMTTGAMNFDFAKRLWLRTGDSETLAYYVDQRLELDPYEPDILRAKSDLLWSSSDPDGARAALQKAMRYGLYRPVIRMLRLHQSLPEARYQEMLDGLEATDDHMRVLSYALQLLEYTETPFTNEDTQRSDFACTRLKILERHKQVCAGNSDHQSCRRPVRRETLIAQDIQNGACGTQRSKSWQDQVRDLFGLNE
ncbi:MAG: hypothetical protein AAF557_00685 [Pseudomonadota bacterium]